MEWLASHGCQVRDYSADAPANRELILVGAAPSARRRAELAATGPTRIACGASVVFLSPSVFRQDDNLTRWLPLKNKGSLPTLMGWLYHKDEWAKTHPVFKGLPAGGMMDYAYYREIIPDAVFTGQEPPVQAIAGANNASFDYSSGLMTAEYRLGEGRFLLNTLLIRENLGKNPVAERLLRNMLRYMAPDANGTPAPWTPALEVASWGTGILNDRAPRSSRTLENDELRMTNFE